MTLQEDQQTTAETTASGIETAASANAKGAMHRVRIGGLFGWGGMEVESPNWQFVFGMVLTVLLFVSGWLCLFWLF